MPPKDDSAEQEGKKVGAFVRGFLEGAIKNWKDIALILGVVGVGYGYVKPPEVDSFTKQELRQVIRAEVDPIRAGLEALAKTQKPETRIAVLEAMANAKEKYRER